MQCWLIMLHTKEKPPIQLPLIHPNQKLPCFVLNLKIINTFLKTNICILKQTVQGTQKWYWKFSRPSVFF